MSTQTQVRRDTLSNLNTVIPADGEIAYNITDDRIHMGDGSTLGGIPHVNFKDLQKQYFNYVAAGGTGNAITLSLPYTPVSLTAGLKVKWKATAGNSGATTLDVGVGGTKNVYKLEEGALVALAGGEIISGAIYESTYDGTQWQLYGHEQAGTPSGVVFLGSATASNSASLDFTGLITSDYTDYTFSFDQLSAGDTLRFRGSVNNGSSWYSSASYDFYNAYPWTYSTGGGVSFGALSHGGNAAPTSATSMRFMNGSGSYSAAGPSNTLTLGGVTSLQGGEITIFNPLAGGSIQVGGWFNGLWCAFRGSFSVGGACNAIQFAALTGNISSGTIRMYGRKSS